jgi:hypothetical protein
MRGLPHSNDLEEAVKGELWAGVTPSGRSPVIWIPMKGVLRAVKPRVEGLIPNNTKLYETRTPLTSCVETWLSIWMERIDTMSRRSVFEALASTLLCFMTKFAFVFRLLG